MVGSGLWSGQRGMYPARLYYLWKTSAYTYTPVVQGLCDRVTEVHCYMSLHMVV